MIVYAKAPGRIDFCGSWTDVPGILPDGIDSYVFNVAIDLYWHCLIRDIPANRVKLINASTGEELVLNEVDERKDIDDFVFDAILTVLRRYEIRQRVTVLVWSDMPKSSGLGSSSSLIVSLIGAARVYTGRIGLDKLDIAREAFEIEREDMAQDGGTQDQYAASLGGANIWSFSGKRLREYRTIKLDKRVEDSITLIWTGEHSSPNMIMKARERAERHRAELVKMASIARNLLDKKGRLTLNEIQAVVVDHMSRQTIFMPDSVTETMLEILSLTDRKNIVFKPCGAGGGGTLMLIGDVQKTHLSKLLPDGCKLLPFHFDVRGLTVTQTRGSI